MLRCYLLSDHDYEDEGLEVEEEEEAALRDGDEAEEVLFDAVGEGVRCVAREESWRYCCPRRIYLALYM